MDLNGFVEFKEIGESISGYYMGWSKLERADIAGPTGPIPQRPLDQGLIVNETGPYRFNLSAQTQILKTLDSGTQVTVTLTDKQELPGGRRLNRFAVEVDETTWRTKIFPALVAKGVLGADIQPPMIEGAAEPDPFADD